jgi:hypothetical protein
VKSEWYKKLKQSNLSTAQILALVERIACCE